MTRIHGLDLARALAIIGMMAAHTGPDHVLTSGFPSVLFAVLAGVSMGIISSRAASPADARFRLLTRAVILVGLGVLLAAVQSHIVIVLVAIGVSYTLLLPTLTWRARWLGVLLAALVVLGPVVVAAQEVWPVAWNDEFFTDLLGWPYPITAWTAYTVLGLLIHRVALRREVLLLSLGAAVLITAGRLRRVAALDPALGDEHTFAGAWLQGEPHSGGFFDVLTAGGVATAVIGLCLFFCRAAAIVWVTYPLRSFGAMSLTIYVSHVIITTIANGSFIGMEPQAPNDPGAGAADFGWTMYPSDPVPAMPAEDPLWPTHFVAQLVIFLVFASLWRWRFRRGPGEWAMHRAVEATVGESR